MARVLIIAEERLARRMAWILESAGHTATATASAEEGVLLARDGHPEIVVTNGVIPRDELPRFTARVEQASPGVAFIDTSHQAGSGEPPVEADAQLTQPFHADELLSEVDRLARR